MSQDGEKMSEDDGNRRIEDGGGGRGGLTERRKLKLAKS